MNSENYSVNSDSDIDIIDRIKPNKVTEPILKILSFC